MTPSYYNIIEYMLERGLIKEPKRTKYQVDTALKEIEAKIKKLKRGSHE